MIAVPEQVVDANNTFTGGLKGARGVYKFGLNSKENVICYNITITGFHSGKGAPVEKTMGQKVSSLSYKNFKFQFNRLVRSKLPF